MLQTSFVFIMLLSVRKAGQAGRREGFPASAATTTAAREPGASFNPCAHWVERVSVKQVDFSPRACVLGEGR